ncbi:fibulin-1-like [Anthonomus grandis grandis]|uniref:fibulin-1-like n=1 Tax=Anthonomus grandis grandis TaxID=2921223 RepID=UPI002165D142|nr:fibulin-1-like [Anthonomus grandis grandis]XP_050313740.1 fibulin-1-like [Anthonomus grandis grandis]
MQVNLYVTMRLLVFLILPLVMLCQGYNLTTRQLCCTIGTNYSLSGKGCKTFHPPIPGIAIEDERACVSMVDLCCKKQVRLLQCNAGKKDAVADGICVDESEDRRDCCEYCRLGIEAKHAGETCVDSLGLGSPFTDVFTNCCEEASNINKMQSSVEITTFKSFHSETLEKGYTESTNHTMPLSFPHYPGLSEENVCETGEFCAQLCESTGKSFKCSCFAGYELMKDEVSCKPIKRAKGSRCERNNPCDHDCTDTGTAIECACRDGFELATDKKTCKDIDECALGIHQCGPDEECENEMGDYSCFITVLYGESDDGIGKCPTGHRFNAEKSTCDDIDECNLNVLSCVPPLICKNTIGSFTCEAPECPPGFYYKYSIESCADIDECTTGNNDCNKESQLCVNMKGTYTCVDKVSKNACPAGFKKNIYTMNCDDIDECENVLKVCLENQECINEQGGYKCIDISSGKKEHVFLSTVKPTDPPVCHIGFRYNHTQKTCDDINECQLRLDNCSAMHRCDNTIGSFHCNRIVSCGTGYTLNSASDLCEDDDECQLGTHNCFSLGSNYKCKNLIGSYRCELVRSPPVVVTPSTSTVASTTQVVTPKSTIPIGTSSQRSIFTTFLTQSNKTSSTTAHLSNAVISTTLKPISITNAWGEPFYSNNRRQPWWYYQRPLPLPTTVKRYYTTPPAENPVTKRTTYLKNTYSKTVQRTTWTTSLPIISGMSKKCLPGYRMNSRGDCEDIDECQQNPCPNRTKCLNYNGGFQCTMPLICKIGYEPNLKGDQCIDVDECIRGTHSCSVSQICKNGQGYYTCECPPGHHLNRNTQTCEDLDECKFYKPCGSYADCTNSVGSYTCSCRPGFKMNQNFCDDINECEEIPELCQDNCVNIWGSYRCACKPGFTLNVDNRTCTDINECEKFNDRKLCIGNCRNTPGSYICECPSGYKLGQDHRACIDIDECSSQGFVCKSDEACVNTHGGYKCYPITCSGNYIKDRSHKARCKRLTCDARDNQCLLQPEQYSYQFMALVSDLPLADESIPLYKLKGPDWASARAEFSLQLLDVNCPPSVKRVDRSYFKEIFQENNLMELHLVRSIEGPQEVKLQIEMKLLQQNNLVGSVVVYIVMVVSEYPF